MELVRAGRMDWAQQRQCVLPTALPSSMHPAVSYSERQGRWATTELLASNVGGKWAHHKSHHAEVYLFTFQWRYWR